METVGRTAHCPKGLLTLLQGAQQKHHKHCHKLRHGKCQLALGKQSFLETAVTLGHGRRDGGNLLEILKMQLSCLL